MSTTTVDNTVRDYRGSGSKRPVWEVTCAQMIWADNNTDTIKSTVGINGVIKRITANYSTGDADPDLTLVITDADGNSVFAPGAKDDGQVHIFDADGSDFGENQLAFFDGFVVSVVSGDPGNSGVTADITIVGI